MRKKKAYTFRVLTLLLGLTFFIPDECGLLWGQPTRKMSLESSSPVMTVGAESIQTYSTSDVTEIIKSLPQQHITTQRTSNFQLRGLGSNRTLVLLDGKRNVVYGQSVNLDLNAIPIAAIEKIEIITDGGATYGADAVSGVVNFMTRDELSPRLENNIYSAYYKQPQVNYDGFSNDQYQAWITESSNILTATPGLQSLPDNTYGSGGNMELNIQTLHDFRVQEIKMRDEDGNLRQASRIEWYPENYNYREDWYYNCDSVPQHYTRSFTDINGYQFQLNETVYEAAKPEINYSQLFNEPSLKLYYNDSYYGFRPNETKWAAYSYKPDRNCENDDEDDENGCDKNIFYGGVSLLLEDFGGGRERFPGAFLNYTRMLSENFGLTGHLGWNQKELFNWTYTNTRALAGISFTPLPSANCNDDFILTTQLLLGTVRQSRKDPQMKFSDCYFSGMAGATGAYHFSDDVGIRIGAHYAPTFASGNTANNYIISLGARFQF